MASPRIAQPTARPIVQHRQILSAPFLHAWSAKNTVPIEISKDFVCIKSKLDRPGAIYFPGFEVLTIGPALEADFHRLDRRIQIHGLSIREIVGPERIAQAVANALVEREKRQIVYERHRQLFFLPGTPLLTASSGGFMRDASHDDIDFMIQSYPECFPDEECYPEPPGLRVDAIMSRALDQRSAFIWDDGGPRACAIFGGTDGATAEITTLMTPSKFRRRGYASSLVIGMVGFLEDNHPGLVPVLQVDTGNPTARSIYEKLGFEPGNVWSVFRLSLPG